MKINKGDLIVLDNKDELRVLKVGKTTLKCTLIETKEIKTIEIKRVRLIQTNLFSC